MNTHTNSRTLTRTDERGMAAIMITMVIMSVIALIVLGFAAISRREQRMALDKQLQTQAFYAAESGVNDALKIIKANIGGSALPADEQPFTWESDGIGFDSCSGSCAKTGNYVYNTIVGTATPTYNLDNASRGPAHLTVTYKKRAPVSTTTLKISVNGVLLTSVQLTGSTADQNEVVDMTLPSGSKTLTLSWEGGMMFVGHLKLDGEGSVASGSDINKQDCENSGLYASLGSTSILADGVSYSCVLVDAHPKTLSYQSLSDVDSWVVPLTTKGSSAPNSIKLTWWPSGARDGDPKNDCKNEIAGKFVPASGSDSRVCRYPVLRVDLVDIGDGSINITSNLNDRLSTYYFQPTTGSGGSSTTTFTPSGRIDANVPQAVLVNTCDKSGTEYGTCEVSITGGTSSLTRNMAIRVTSLYGASDMTVQALSGTTALALYDAQATIDVTGKAQDVLRRIQVHIPLQSASISLPGALVNAGPICKRYTTYTNNFEINTSLKDPNNPLCSK